MNQEQVLNLMKSSKNEAEWNANCDKVKADNKGLYPDYWYKEVIQTRLADTVLGAGASEIKVVTF